MQPRHPYRDSQPFPYSADEDIFELLDEPSAPKPASPYQANGTQKAPDTSRRPPEENEVSPAAKRRKRIFSASGAEGADSSRQRGIFRKKRRRKRCKLWQNLVCAAVSLVLVGAAGLGIYLAAATAHDDLWLDLDQIPYKTETILYYQTQDGSFAEYSTLQCTQNKVYTPSSEIPDQLRQAFIAVEDQDFYRHNGVNWKRTLFAIFNEGVHAITGWYPGGVKQGASTIDQQLIKNLTREDESTGLSGYLRKVTEIYRACRLDASSDKDVILDAYLNTISFTGNTAGVGAAAEKIFGCSPAELSLAQCASLAAITRSPARYDPETHPEEHLERRNYVLDQMLAEGYIDQTAHDAAVAEPLVTTGNSDPERDETPTDWFTDLVMEEVITDLSQQYNLSRSEASRLLYDGGLRIYTTVVPELQSAMERTLQQAWIYPQPGKQITAQLTDEETGQPLTDEEGDPVTGQVTVYPQAAMVSLDYEGRICAVVGGLGEKDHSRAYNRATQATRQVGSTMKPIGAYVLALEKDQITWSSSFLDEPVRQIEDEETGELKDWPANFSKTYSGENLLVADALARSINTIAVRVGEQAGVSAIYRFTTQKLGITSFTSQDKASAPMILGASTYGVSPLEMAAAYAMFGSGGVYTTPYCYSSVQRATGSELLSPKVESRQVISADTAYIMNRLLRQVMVGEGTAAGYSVPGSMDSVGKTGTTSDNKDHWFIGLTPYYVTASWYGYDESLPLAVNYNAHPPTLAWRNVMAAAQANLEPISFPVDDTVTQQRYCTVSGSLAGDGCPSAVGYYKADALPEAVCPVHGG